MLWRSFQVEEFGLRALLNQELLATFTTIFLKEITKILSTFNFLQQGIKMFRLCIVPASLESFGAIRNKEVKYYARLTEEASSFDEIKKKRRLSTEIVVDEKGNIVKDTSWLWDWEIKDKKSYAMECIKKNLQIELPKGPFFPYF